MTKKPLVVGGQYRITWGGIGYPHMSGLVGVASDERYITITSEGAYRGYLVPASDVNYKRAETGWVCKCKAYKWPHRLGGGTCFANTEPPFCGNCGQPCSGTFLSNCCNAELCRDPELKEMFLS